MEKNIKKLAIYSMWETIGIFKMLPRVPLLFLPYLPYWKQKFSDRTLSRELALAKPRFNPRNLRWPPELCQEWLQRTKPIISPENCQMWFTSQTPLNPRTIFAIKIIYFWYVWYIHATYFNYAYISYTLFTNSLQTYHVFTSLDSYFLPFPHLILTRM